MKLMYPKNLCVSAVLALAAITLTFTTSLPAQKRSNDKKAAARKADDKRSRSSAKDVKKDRSARDARSKATAKAEKARKEKEKTKAKDKATAKERARDKKEQRADARAKKDPRKAAEIRRAEAERRRREEERRQAIIAEQRRREQAAREARARRIAFENGLRTETAANILNDRTEGEDLAVRQAAVNALGSHAGSVVVMEAKTGKVLTIVNQAWAVRDSIKPCSTIKLVTGVAGLNENVIARENGALRTTPTRLNLDDALAFSNNGYFQRVGVTVGNEKMVQYARQMGLGEPTGVNVDGETAGRLAVGNSNPRIYSHGDDFEVSTLQLAVMVSAISNGGYRVIPRIPRNQLEKTQFQPFYRSRIELPQQNLRRVIPGMMGAAEYGTARRGVNAALGIAGKTGSCISKGTWVGLFASVAPIEQPKYAVAVITRGQSERGKYAAAVAGKIYQALAAQIVRTDTNLAQTEFKLPPRGGVLPTYVAAKPVIEEDEDDDVDISGATEVAGQTDLETEPADAVPAVVVPIRAPAKKLVTRTGSSKPVFPPVVITYDKDKDAKAKAARP